MKHILPVRIFQLLLVLFTSLGTKSHFHIKIETTKHILFNCYRLWRSGSKETFVYFRHILRDSRGKVSVWDIINFVNGYHAFPGHCVNEWKNTPMNDRKAGKKLCLWITLYRLREKGVKKTHFLWRSAKRCVQFEKETKTNGYSVIIFNKCFYTLLHLHTHFYISTFQRT